MAEPLDPKDLVTVEELALSNMWETSALAVAGPLDRPGGGRGDGGASSVLVDQLVGSNLRTAAIRV